MRRINPGDAVATAGSFLLLVSLFLDWYSPGLEGWTVFEVWDVVLAGLALATVAQAAADLGWWRGPALPVRPPVLAGASTVIVLVALLNHPPAAVGADTAGGIWLALLGAVLMLVGAGLGEGRVSLTLHVERRAPAPAAAPPAPGPAPVVTERRGSLLDDDEADTRVLSTRPADTARDETVPPGATS